MNPAEQLFGSVRKLPYKGNLPVPIPQLLEPLPVEKEGEKYAVWFFCKGCGTVLPVLKSAVKKIVGSELEEYEGMFIQTKRCDVCGDQFENPQLEKIPIQ